MSIEDDYENVCNIIEYILSTNGDNDYILEDTRFQIPDRFYKYFSNDVIIETQENIIIKQINEECNDR